MARMYADWMLQDLRSSAKSAGKSEVERYSVAALDERRGWLMAGFGDPALQNPGDHPPQADK